MDIRANDGQGYGKLTEEGASKINSVELGSRKVGRVRFDGYPECG
jgi:hypothetical protein